MIPNGVAGAARQSTCAHWRALARAEGSESFKRTFKENGIVVAAVSRATRASVKVF